MIGEVKGELVGRAADGTLSSLGVQRRSLRRAVGRGLRVYYRLMPAFPRLLQDELSGMASVLDVGCGRRSPLQVVPGLSWTLGVDLFRPYLLDSAKRRIHNAYALAHVSTLECKPGSVDAVICLNVLEHLTKRAGRRLIGKMEKWARAKVLLYTSNGYHEQEAYDQNPHQEHVSGWRPEEFVKLGYRVLGVGGWRRMLALRKVSRLVPEPVWNLWCSISSLAIAKNPEASIDLLCVKDVG